MCNSFLRERFEVTEQRSNLSAVRSLSGESRELSSGKTKDNCIMNYDTVHVCALLLKEQGTCSLCSRLFLIFISSQRPVRAVCDPPHVLGEYLSNTVSIHANLQNALHDGEPNTRTGLTTDVAMNGCQRYIRRKRLLEFRIMYTCRVQRPPIFDDDA